MPLILRVPLAPPVTHPKNRAQMMHRKEYESLYAAMLYAKQPTNMRKLSKAVEKGVEYGQYTCQDDSY